MKEIKDEDKNIVQQLIAIADEFCENYCKYQEKMIPENPKDEDEDMLEEMLYTEYCTKCPMRHLI